MYKSKSAKAFAKSVLSNGSVPLSINQELVKLFNHSAFECVIYRDGQAQIELVYMFPNVTIENHCHPHVDAAELWLGGMGDALINGLELPKQLDVSSLLKNLSRIRPGVYHGGKTGSDGVAYLSFQLWHGIAPSFISCDWKTHD